MYYYYSMLHFLPVNKLIHKGYFIVFIIPHQFDVLHMFQSIYVLF